MHRWIGSAALAALVFAWPVHAQTNVLLLLADDLGVDRVAAYGEHPDPGHTPVIDGLAAGGVLFRNAWSTPVCSPTRASLLTGRHPERTGVGNALKLDKDSHDLWPGEVTLPRLLEPDVACMLVGKWHLVLNQPGKLTGLGSPLLHPLACGFRTWSGSLTVLDGDLVGDAYYHWTKITDGAVSLCNDYNTTTCVDDALAMIACNPEPWFLEVAFHAPHTPYHKPPHELHTFNLPQSVFADLPLHAKAAIEAMDTEIGRLLASMDPVVRSHTVVIFAGDNGTANTATTPPFPADHAKGTLYEGGINVPLIIQGPGVAAGAECAGLVSTTDLFATIADVFGVAHPTGIDSVSLLPYFSDPGQTSLRPTVFSEWFDPPGYGPYEQRHRAVRDERFKLIRHDGHPNRHDELYDLLADPFEACNLLPDNLTPEAAGAYAKLLPELELTPEPWQTVGLGVFGRFGEPRLVGAGNLSPGSKVTVTVMDARPVSPGVLFGGACWGGYKFAKGVLGPEVDFGFAGLATDATGRLDLNGAWPVGLLPGQQIVLQFWLLDHASPQGLAATNNLIITVPAD